MVWTLVEPGAAIVASSLATIRPLLRALRIKGFESTDHTGDTGGLSGAPRSGTNRSFHMAPYPKHDLEAQAIQPMKSHSLSVNPEPEMLPIDDERIESRQEKKRRDEMKSEIFIIEGDRLHETWRDNTIASQSSSSVDVDDIDAPSQENGRVGLEGAYYGYAR
jgi:hypothetical protein